MTDTEQQPAIRILGPATAEDVAAVVAVLAAAGGGGEDIGPDRPVSLWASRAAAVRAPVQHGPGAWRATLRP